MKDLTENPCTSFVANGAAAVPAALGNAVSGNAVSVNAVALMPRIPSWSHVSTPNVGRIDGTRIAAIAATADNYTGTFVAALTKQGAPPRGEPR